MPVSHDALLLVERSRDWRHGERDADRRLDHTRIQRGLAADDGGVELVPVLDSENRPGVDGGRSEEHTSELQSLMRISYAVFCLKTKTNIYKYLLSMKRI